MHYESIVDYVIKSKRERKGRMRCEFIKKTESNKTFFIYKFFNTYLRLR